MQEKRADLPPDENNDAPPRRGRCPHRPAVKCSDYRNISANSYHVQRADVGIGPYGIVLYLTRQTTIFMCYSLLQLGRNIVPFNPPLNYNLPLCYTKSIKQKSAQSGRNRNIFK